MREDLLKLAEVTGYKVKVIEKAGECLDRKLIISDEMEGSHCERDLCRLCWSKHITKKQRQSCTRHTLTYRPQLELI